MLGFNIYGEVAEIKGEMSIKVTKPLNLCAMSALPQKTLEVVPAPLVPTAATNAPPVLEDQNPTVEYRCGGCGAVLMRADKNKLHALIIHCTSCDAYNSVPGIKPPLSVQGD